MTSRCASQNHDGAPDHAGDNFIGTGIGRSQTPYGLINSPDADASESTHDTDSHQRRRQLMMPLLRDESHVRPIWPV